ncbi:MAG: hypothetical protein LBC35_04790 [Coriobacteriales bacterium]|nr:hypothetical protein [Coriobacteriales bacterium]
MEFFIAVIVVLVAMNAFFFLIVRGITVRLGKFAQMNVLRQAGVFDNLIRRKQEQLTTLNAQIAASQESQLMVNDADRALDKPAPDYLEIHQGPYASDYFASAYQIIRDNFQRDEAACVQESLAKMPTGNGDSARAAHSILSELTLDSAYELSTLSSQVQLDILEEMFKPEQVQLLRTYQDTTDEFQSYQFLFWLKDYVFLNADQVTVCTASEDKSFDYLDERITTLRDDSICEGIYVLSKGRKFDYSIRNREIIG